MNSPFHRLWNKYLANRLAYALIYITSVTFWCAWAFQSDYDVHANKVTVASDLFGASTGTAVITIAIIEGVDVMLSRILIREAQEKGLETGRQEGREEGRGQGREEATKEHEAKLLEWARARGIDPADLPSLKNGQE